MEYVGMIITIVIMLFVAYIYSGLTNARNKSKECYTKLDTLLKTRWDFVTEFVKTVQNSSVFEEKTLENLTTLRNQDFDKFKMDQKIKVDKNISKVISKMLEILENDQDLKDNENYINLNKKFFELEKEISNIKKEYNKVVKEYNKQIESVPNNIVAILFGFNEEKI